MDPKQFETGKSVHAQTILHEGKVKALVELTGEKNTKDAIVKAVDEFIRNQEEKKE